MRGKELFEKITNIDNDIITRTSAVNKKRKLTYIKWASIVACFAIIIIGVYSILPKGNIIFEDENVTVQAVDFSKTLITSSSADLVMLTEEEIFNGYNTDIFKGTVTDIQNIEIDFDGEVVYRSIVTISVQDVYRGGLQTDEEVTILLPIPIDVNGYWVSDTDVVSQINVGMTGIFMPLVLNDESAMWQENDVWFDKRGIVDYGLLDGERYVFLENEKGLVFAEWAFESISDAQTLDDIEEYIVTMIE